MAKSLKERLADQQKDLKSRMGGYKFFMIKEGKTRMRALPTGEENDFAIEATTFYLGKDLGMVVSPVTFGGKCAIMNGYNSLVNSKKESDRKFAKTFKPSKRFFSPHIRYKDVKGQELDVESGVKLLMLTTGQYNDLIDLFLDEDEAGDFTHPIKGYDIKYIRTGKTKTDTEYSIMRCNPSKLPKQFRGKDYDPTAMLKEITPSYSDTKDILNKFTQMEPEADDDDQPRKKKKKIKKDL